MQSLIQNATKNNKINILLEYVDYFASPDSINSIISQFDPETTIGDIRDNLIVAFGKLDLYVSLIQAAVRVSGAHYHKQFLMKERNNTIGFHQGQDSRFLCDCCGKELIEYDKL